MRNSPNKIYIAIGAVLLGIILTQSYFLYDLKKESLQSQPTVTKPFVTDLFQDPVFKNSDHFKPFQEMQEEMDKAFSKFNSHFANDPLFNRAFRNFSTSPLSDIQDKGDHYLIEMNIPGTDNNQLDIKVEENRLSIKAETLKSTETNSSNYLRRERYANRFSRTLVLPDDADGNKLKSDYKDGVLMITIPKK